MVDTLGSLLLMMVSVYSFAWKMNLASGLPNQSSMMLITSRSAGSERPTAVGRFQGAVQAVGNV